MNWSDWLLSCDFLINLRKRSVFLATHSDTQPLALSSLDRMDLVLADGPEEEDEEQEDKEDDRCEDEDDDDGGGGVGALTGTIRHVISLTDRTLATNTSGLYVSDVAALSTRLPCFMISKTSSTSSHKSVAE